MKLAQDITKTQSLNSNKKLYDLNLNILIRCRFSHSVDLILKLVGILWNRKSVEVVDKFSSTTVDFIRSERELESMCLYGY